jgi:membrane fusion protein (multidrug efflux system)
MNSQLLERAPAIAGGLAPTATRQSGRRRRVLLGAVGLAVLAVAGWQGVQWWRAGQFFETTDDAYVGGDITVIAPKVAGFITELAVADNQAVRQGDLLLRLDDRDYRAALAKTAAAMAGQRATLAYLDATARLQQAVIAQGQAGIDAADAEIARSRDDQSRYRQLSASAAASVQLFQKADADYRQALAAGARARAVLDAAQRQTEVIATQKQQAEAALAGAIAERDTAQLNLEATELRAPIDGVVGDRSAHVGAYAVVGAQLLAIVPARGLWVDANFKESQIAAMQPGQPVSVAADILPGELFRGHVASLAPATGAEFSLLPAENATGNFTRIVQRVPVRIALDGDAGLLGRLRPGLSVTAAVDGRPGPGR